MAVAPARIAVVIVATVACSAPAAEPAPPPRPVYPRFELTYLPAIGPQGLIAFRPTEIARHAKGPELSAGARRLFDLFFENVMDGDPKAVEPPALADIEQCVFNLQIAIKTTDGGEHGQTYIGGRTPCVIRSVRPLGWKQMIRKWFPKSASDRHAGRTYIRIPCRNLPKDALPFAVYIADDRTLVCGTQAQICQLFDRLAAGEPPPTPPPGWNEVDREFAALVLDNRKVPLVQGETPNRPEAEEIFALLDSIQSVSVGLSVGDRSGVRLAVNVRDERHAKLAAFAVRSAIEAAGTELLRLKESELTRIMATEAVKNTVVERKGRRVDVATSAPGNPIKLLLMAVRGAD